MSLRKLLFIPFLGFLLLLVGFYAQLGKPVDKLPSVMIGKSLPDFKLPLLFEEKSLTPQDMKPGWKLLNVFASWCLACRDEHAIIFALSKKITMIGLNYKDTVLQAKAWLTHFGNPYETVLFDEKGTLGMDLGVYGVPETYLIDENNIIRHKWVGELTEEVWVHQFLPWIDQSSEKLG